MSGDAFAVQVAELRRERDALAAEVEQLRAAMRDLQERALAQEHGPADPTRQECEFRGRQLEATEALQTLNDVGLALSSGMEIEQLLQAITDAATAMVGAELGAFFYNVVDPQGQRHRRYAIAGASSEDLANLPMPRVTRIFEPTSRKDGVIRLDDVTQDPRYGQNAPYAGIPEGHPPVRSYLAIPIASQQGEILGSLLLGHSRPGMFSEHHAQ